MLNPAPWEGKYALPVTTPFQLSCFLIIDTLKASNVRDDLKKQIVSLRYYSEHTKKPNNRLSQY